MHSLINKINKAVQLEEEAQFTNLIGHKESFAEFMLNSFKTLYKGYHIISADELKKQYELYACMNMFDRMNLVKHTKKIINSIEENLKDTLDNNFDFPQKAFDKKPIQKKIQVQDAKIFRTKPYEVEIKWVSGVGEKIALLLNKLDIFTVEDALQYWPRQYLNFKERLLIKDLKAGSEATIVGLVSRVNSFQSPRNPNLSILNVKITDSTGSISLNRFIAGKSSNFLLEQYKKQFPVGSLVMVSGRVQPDRTTRFQLSNFSLQIIDEDGNAMSDSLEVGRIVPVYKLTEGIHQNKLRKIIFHSLTKYENEVEETLSDELRDEFGLEPLLAAIRQIHFPESEERLENAKKRIIFEEFLTMQLPIAMQYHQNSQEKISDLASRKISLSSDGFVNSLLKILPFQLTNAQNRVFNEIMQDLQKDNPMNRLVQGDVGSGKTIVALLAMLIATERGEQAAMMAPTEILAEQHYRKCQEFLSQIGVRVALLIGSMKVSEKRDILTGLANGQISIVVGTHALIQGTVEFFNLGLAVIDEQHRFGVRQRDNLRRKGNEKLADCLFMTATPIPRTLALANFGNLDLSEIDELPPGRKPIKTKIVSGSNRSKAHEFVKKQLLLGRQAYIVYPLIDESESLSAKAVCVEAVKLEKIYRDFKIGVIHGKLTPEEKESVMQDFRKNEIHLLIGTTVIEVGVDVPNSTIMIIENAERFGLAQLHQLRGRVGRGSEQSYCFLFADSKSSNTIERLKIMEETENGFIIAQKDLEIRGPGELMGTRQSGLSDFGLANLLGNYELLEKAKNTARKIVMIDPILENLADGLKRKIERLKTKAGLIESA